VRMMKASGFGARLDDMLATWNSTKLSAAFRHSPSATSEPGADSLSPGLSAVLKAALTAGLYPQLARVSYRPAVDAAANPTRQVCIAQTTQGEAQIHPSSVNRFLAANGWVVYHEKVTDRTLFPFV
jgi:ATP-dependent RNA helicase DHX29